MTAPRTQGKDNQYWTGFPLRFFICAWKYHPSFGWLSPEIRKDGMNMYYDLIESGKRIKELRKKKGMSQSDLAEAISIHVKTVSKAERGVVGLSVDNLVLIAQYFEVSLDYLILGNSGERSIFERIESQPVEKKKKIERIIAEILDL